MVVVMVDDGNCMGMIWEMIRETKLLVYTTCGRSDLEVSKAIYFKAQTLS